MLDVTGFDTVTNNVSFYQVTGSANLTNGATLYAGNNYYQGGGSLTSDSSTVTLKTGLSVPGDINIAGGNVVVDNVANTVGKFSFAAKTIEINGEIDLKGLTTGGRSTQCDKLLCGTATVTLGANSFLNVGTTGTGSLGTGNQWVVMTYGSDSGSWSKVTVPPGMSYSIGGTQILVTN